MGAQAFRARRNIENGLALGAVGDLAAMSEVPPDLKFTFGSPILN
jgi:hypothetical protein